MNYRFIVIAAVIGLLIRPSPIFSQDDNQKMLEHSQRMEREKEARSKNEQKLMGGFFSLMRLAEQAATSPEIETKMKKILRQDSENLQTDSLFRIRVCLYLRSNSYVEEVSSAIRTMGGEIQYIGMTAFINCRIHPAKLRQLISLDGITLIKDVENLRTNFVISEGDRQLKADSVRAQHNVSGFGVKVGVISDGVSHIGNVGGELPPVQLVAPPGVPPAGDGDEGTAMLEIVHDLAPSAELLFGWGRFGGWEGVGDMIRLLRMAGCKVIVDDLFTTTGPFFSDEDPRLGGAIREFIGGGGVYVAAAGNFNYELGSVNGQRMYSGATNFATDGFNIFPDGRKYLEFDMPEGGARVIVQWSTRWDSPTADYDVYIFDENGDPLGETTGGQNRQSPADTIPPIETVTHIYNESMNGPKVYRIAIKRYSGDFNNEFKIWCEETNLGPNPGRTYLRSALTNRKHVVGHRAYPGVIGVAAYHADLTNQMASYSSWGDLKMFSSVANQWTVTQTPVITATSKVHTYVGQLGYFPVEPFDGTSAAAPHIAGIAALYFSKFPTRTRDDFVHDLTTSAVGIDGSTGGIWDRRAGWGKADALACFANVAVTVATPTFDPPGGELPSQPPQYVSIHCATPDAEIHFTTTGLDPDQNSPLYNPSAPIPIVSATDLRAIAFKTSLSPSGIRRAQYTIRPGAPLSVVDETGHQLGGFPVYAIWSSAFGIWHWFFGPGVTTWPNIHEVWIKATQDFRPGTTERFQRWTLDHHPSDYYAVNHAYWRWSGNNSPSAITGYFKHAYPVTIQSRLLEGDTNGDSVGFNDPWLVDDLSDSKGARNRGIGALWYSKSSPFRPNAENSGSGSEHKGVFLNENPAFHSGKPYYSVGARGSGLFGGSAATFACWSGHTDSVVYQNVVSETTGVSFKRPGATATAVYKAHLASSLPPPSPPTPSASCRGGEAAQHRS